MATIYFVLILLVIANIGILFIARFVLQLTEAKTRSKHHLSSNNQPFLRN